MEIYIGNDMVVYVLELKNSLTEDFINTGTVDGQLKNSAGDDVGDPLSFQSAGGPVTIGNRTYEDGNWTAVFEEDEAVVANVRYAMHIDVDAGGDLIAHWEIPTSAIKRTS